eukprot:TRINITY_DN13005_c0_g1_i1.p1 TRINITY_DN13005_c0_g1~~TRINITY_DN13005_c0_g1_i1.p1  ORF type:complete len:916 (+),score=281.28 TRINITY_DN13005_c0_g1_i1:86-2833(+)
MGKGRDKRKKAQDEKGGRNKAKHDKKAREKNLEKHGRRAKEDVADANELREEDIEQLLAQYQRKEAKKREVIVEDCEPPSERTNASFIVSQHLPSEAILFGGEYWNGERTDSYNALYRYNLERNSWKSVTSDTAPPPRSSHQAVCHKHVMLVFGGEFTSPSQSQFYHHRDLWRLDLNTWAWEEIKVRDRSGPTARSGHRMVLWKRTGVLFGGFHDTLTSAVAQYYDDVWLLNNLDEVPRWQRLECKGEGPCKRSAVCLSVYADTLFLYGGFAVEGKYAKGTTFSDMWSLNLLTGVWARVKKAGIPPSVRSGMTCLSVARRAIFFGGVADVDDRDDVKSRFFNEMYQFDMDSRRWYPLLLRRKKKGTAERREARRAKRRGRRGDGAAGDEPDGPAADGAEPAAEPWEDSGAEEDEEEDEEEEEEVAEPQDDMPVLPAAKRKEKRPQPHRSQKTARAIAEREQQEKRKKEKKAARAPDRKCGVPIYIGGQLVGYEDPAAGGGECGDGADGSGGHGSESASDSASEAAGSEGGGSAAGEAAEGEHPAAAGKEDQAAPAAAGEVSEEAAASAPPAAAGAAAEAVAEEEEAPPLQAASASPAPPGFCPAASYTGSREGCVFRVGPAGLGYYLDEPPVPTFVPPVVHRDTVVQPERSRRTYRVLDGEQIVPCGRFGTMMAASGNFLYLYGGQFEDGSREVTLCDLYRLNLNRLDTFEVRMEMDLSKQDWYESSDEGDEADEEDEAGCPVDRPHGGGADSESESGEGAAEHEGGGAAPAAGEPAAAAVAGDGARPRRGAARSKREQLRMQLGAESGLPTPNPGEALRDFSSRTSDFWIAASHEELQGAAPDITAADPAKAMRKEAFRLASRRWYECRPVLEQLEQLEAEEAKERQLREAKGREYDLRQRRLRAAERALDKTG